MKYKLQIEIDWDEFFTHHKTHQSARNSFKKQEKKYWARFCGIINLEEPENNWPYELRT